MKKRILLLEDEVSNQRILKFILGRDFHLSIVENGREAFHWLKHHRTPDLIIMDWIMPIMDGKSFLSKLEEYRNRQDIPVIVLSSYEYIHEELETASYKTRTQLRKPVNPQLLRSAVASVVFPID